MRLWKPMYSFEFWGDAKGSPIGASCLDGQRRDDCAQVCQADRSRADLVCPSDHNYVGYTTKPSEGNSRALIGASGKLQRVDMGARARATHLMLTTVVQEAHQPESGTVAQLLLLLVLLIFVVWPSGWWRQPSSSC